MKPLLCRVPGCTYMRPCARDADLQRHIMSRHKSEGRHDCNKCTRSFYRKDKFKLHVATTHGQHPCPWTHCPRSGQNGLSSEESFQKHIEKDHGDWECHMRSCGSSTLTSRFGSQSLLRHIRHDHNVPLHVAKEVGDRLESEKRQILKDTDISGLATDYRDCKHCQMCSRWRWESWTDISNLVYMFSLLEWLSISESWSCKLSCSLTLTNVLTMNSSFPSFISRPISVRFTTKVTKLASEREVPE
jgi:hypothetical protein